MSPTPGLNVSAQTFSFFDSFDDNRHQWPLTNQPEQHARIEEGSYFLTGKSRALPFFAARDFPETEADSFELSVEIIQLSGKKNMGYGLCWGARQDRRDCFVFLISSNQQFTILRMERGRYRQLQPWTETDIIAGRKEPNTLSVRKEGNKYLYFINDQRVFTGASDRLLGPLAGVILHGSMELKVEEFTLEWPPE